VVIVGGGISGLSTAYYLAKAGIPSTLIERRPHLGGVIRTDVVDGCVLEAGPDSFLAAKPWALELIHELGLKDQVIGSNDHLRVTYVWKNGRLVPLPDGMMLMVPTKIRPMIGTRLLSWPTKIRMGLEYFRSPAGRPAPDRSVAAFIEEHYGSETVEYLAEPLLAGVYGGDPARLSVTSVLGRFVELETRYGSLTRGVLAERQRSSASSNSLPLFQTLKGGLGQLVQALESACAPHVQVIQATAAAIEPGFRVRMNGDWIEAGHIVLACPAHEAAHLAAGVDSELGELLSGVPYNSSMTLALVYDRYGFDGPLNGFGFLVPRKERRRLIACTWVGTKFSHRVPDDRVVLRCFLGGAGDEQALAESDERVVEAVREELRDIMGVTAAPLFYRISRWPRSMAQYVVGHQDRTARVFERLKTVPGLHLAGNAYTGIGIPDCIKTGRDAADAIVTTKGDIT
jgi:oxygen-dependent protoporphyrinogen oxidase